MSTIRTPKAQEGFTVIMNSLACAGPGLSFGCRGLLLYLLSKPPDWDVKLIDLQREGGIGKTARLKLMAEAESAGYLTCEKGRNKAGLFTTFYQLHREPVEADKRTYSIKKSAPEVYGKDSARADYPEPVNEPNLAKMACIPALDNQLTKPCRIINTDNQILNKENNMSSCSATTTIQPVGEIKLGVGKEVQEIFDHWRHTLGHKKAKLTPDRASKIKARLKEGYTVGECKRAIQGCGLSPFHRGENESGVLYDDISLIFRNGSKLEFFIKLTQNRKPDLSRPADSDGYGMTANGRGTYNGRPLEI